MFELEGLERTFSSRPVKKLIVKKLEPREGQPVTLRSHRWSSSNWGLGSKNSVPNTLRFKVGPCRIYKDQL